MSALKGTRGKDVDRSVTLLHFAASRGQLMVVHQLLREGVNVNIRTRDGYTPLHEACASGQTYISRNLLKAGADVNAISCAWETPLYSACQGGSAECVQLLLDSGAKLSVSDNTLTPVHAAVIHGSTDCLKLLLQAEPRLHQMDSYYGTSLHAACMSGQVECARLLLNAGTDPNIPRKRDFNFPLHEAALSKCHEMVQLLLSYGANPHNRNKNGNKPINLASNDSPVYQVLLIHMQSIERLSGMCRHTIRTSIKRNVPDSIKSLPLPHPLIDYLSYLKP